uniref:Amine oxidase domain-containing protein n=1 Tax=Clastoptera arizonana TaxID=38151 RepID=A0A1B6D392_9HEMI
MKPTKIKMIKNFSRMLSRQSIHFNKNKDSKSDLQLKVEPGKCQSIAADRIESIMSKCMFESSTELPKVVIVGAGMAGLSAGQRLASCGITDFTILEAIDRPGGRIQSCWLGDVVAELGAQWIYGSCINNPVFTLACQENLIKPPIYRYKPNSGLFLTSDGRAIEHSVGLTAYNTFKQIEHQAYSLFSLGSDCNHGTLMNFFSIRIQQELQDFPENQRYDVARIMFGLTNNVRSRWGADLSQISVDQFGSYIEVPGGNIRLPLGFVGVLAPLIREIPDSNIKYCKPVQTIHWDTAGECSPKAAVKCCDGEEFTADYVIVTVSLGVLKKQNKKLFTPTLPDEKLEAINKLGFGCTNKIFLEYTKPFWLCQEGDTKLAWSLDELMEKDDWVKGICSLKEMAGGKHVLQATVSGEEASVIESLSDKEIAEKLTLLLRQFSGDPTLPYPYNILRSKWSSDPYFMGTSSFMALDSTVGHQCDLGSPLPGACESTPPILLFAGEATCPGYFSTVHGARVSGVREAERIIQLTKNKALLPHKQKQEKMKTSLP